MVLFKYLNNILHLKIQQYCLLFEHQTVTISVHNWSSLKDHPLKASTRKDCWSSHNFNWDFFSSNAVKIASESSQTIFFVGISPTWVVKIQWNITYETLFNRHTNWNDTLIFIHSQDNSQYKNKLFCVSIPIVMLAAIRISGKCQGNLCQ